MDGQPCLEFGWPSIPRLGARAAGLVLELKLKIGAESMPQILASDATRCDRPEAWYFDRERDVFGQTLEILFRSRRCGRALAAEGRTARADIGCNLGEAGRTRSACGTPCFAR